eukprot:3763539-Pyramimonas_sp.AAC.1
MDGDWTADAACAFLQGRLQERALYAKVPRDSADLRGIELDAPMKLIMPSSRFADKWAHHDVGGNVQSTTSRPAGSSSTPWTHA